MQYLRVYWRAKQVFRVTLSIDQATPATILGLFSSQRSTASCKWGSTASKQVIVVVFISAMATTSPSGFPDIGEYTPHMQLLVSPRRGRTADSSS